MEMENEPRTGHLNSESCWPDHENSKAVDSPDDGSMKSAQSLSVAEEAC